MSGKAEIEDDHDRACSRAACVERPGRVLGLDDAIALRASRLVRRKRRIGGSSSTTRHACTAV